VILILPYLEQQNFYRQWDFNLSYYSQPSSVLLTQVPLFYCPTRRTSNSAAAGSTSGDVLQGTSNPNVPGALGDYAACTGDPSGVADYLVGMGTPPCTDAGRNHVVVFSHGEARNREIGWLRQQGHFNYLGVPQLPIVPNDLASSHFILPP